MKYLLHLFPFLLVLLIFSLTPTIASAQMADMPMPSPTPSNTQTPTPTQGEFTVRRNIYSLRPDEVTRLINAINTLRANGTYDRFMQEHMQAMMTMTPLDDPISDRNAAHRGPVFLPWHRAFIWEFEQELRRVDPSVSLPYWAFEQENAASIPLVFSPQYFGGDGNTVQQDRVTDSRFNWIITRRIGRSEGGQSLPTQADVNTLLQINDYDTFPFNEQSQGFRAAIEGWTGTNAPWGMHNQVHRYVGGDMLPDDAMTTNAVNDPIFWLVHANIDRIWWQWQQTHGLTNYQPQAGGPTGHNLNDIMQFLPRQGTPANTFDIQNSMRYNYN